jgi:glycosyltransferase involved in cell wall biosynthesis
MDPSTRIGPADADIIVLNKGSREIRLDRLERGDEAPREFFYGFLELEKAGLSAAMMSSSTQAPGVLGMLSDRIERAFAALTHLGVRPLSARLASRLMGTPKVLISYTDGCSLSLGLGYPRQPDGPALVGGFHGLCDIERRAPASMRVLVRALIRRSLAGLDHVFFFGPADRAVAIERYDLAPERSSVIAFGVDTDFWRPLSGVTPVEAVIAVGQDANRDYDLLAAAPGNHPTHIVSRRKVNVPSGATHVRVTTGDFFGSDSMTDEDLRRAYNAARAVVVPLKDVHQPTGYSVTLQAMSCARPVILSNIKGLWTKTLLRDGVNCLLVPPGDARALGDAIGRVRSDPQFADGLGRAARDTVRAHFGLDTMGQHTVALARLGLTLRASARPPLATA